MRRRLIALCVLAYPRATRGADAVYLRDLALDFVDGSGFGRQLMSLLRGGLAQRFESSRLRRPAVPIRWAVAGAFAVAVVAIVCGLAYFGSADTDIEVHSCVETGSRADGCSDLRRIAADKERDGWVCTSQRRLVDGRRLVGVECRRTA